MATVTAPAVVDSGAILTVTNKVGETQIVGFANDYSWGDFVYCKGKNGDSTATVNHFTGDKGTGLMISCSESANDRVTTRGRVDIDLREGLSGIKIEGQRKVRLRGWITEVNEDCQNLKLKKAD